MSSLVENLVRDGHLRTDSIIDAFSKIHREKFVSQDLVLQSEADVPLPIGNGQTISQPMTVAFMLELLDPQKGQNILDVGSGSGWTTGLLAHIVGEKGSVVALEILEQLCNLGKKNVEKFGFVKKGIVQFYCESGVNGFEKNAPYDRILVSAAVEEIPVALKNQLTVGGKMVIPVNNEIWCVEKESDIGFHVEKFSGFSFVPFV